MLSSCLRKVMKALLTLLVVAWITTDANAMQLLRSRRSSRSQTRYRAERIGYWAKGWRMSVKKTSLGRSTR